MYSCTAHEALTVQLYQMGEYMMKNNLAAIMGDRLVTITDVYKATGIARSTLVRLYYRRAKNISLETLKTLCDYFGISLSDLIEYNPKTKQPI